MHNKYIIIDNSLVITGSFNWSADKVAKSANNLLMSNSPLQVHLYMEDFNRISKISVNLI